MGKNNIIKIFSTPLFYINASPHIGHFYSYVLADFFKKSYEIININMDNQNNCLLLTGTDEHGNKVYNAAIESDKLKNKYENTELIIKNFSFNSSSIFKKMFISDIFVRTSQNRHKEFIKKIWNKLDYQDDIYKGLYYESEERFITEREAKETNLLEKCYYLEESGRSINIKNNRDYLIKKINNLLASYSSDYINLANDYIKKSDNIFITRNKKNNYGIEIDDKVVYVWLDALVGYISCLPEGYNFEINNIIGKDILRMHSTLYLKVLEIFENQMLTHPHSVNQMLPHSVNQMLPHSVNITCKNIIVHGHIKTFNNKKIAKSDPSTILSSDKILSYTSKEKLRFFLCASFPLGSDFYINEEMIIAFDNFIKQKIGNLFSRSLNIFKDEIIDINNITNNDIYLVNSLKDRLYKSFKDPHDFYLRIIDEVNNINKLISNNKIWENKNYSFVIIESLAYILKALYPFIPDKSTYFFKKIFGKNILDKSYSFISTEGVFKFTDEKMF